MASNPSGLLRLCNLPTLQTARFMAKLMGGQRLTAGDHLAALEHGIVPFLSEAKAPWITQPFNFQSPTDLVDHGDQYRVVVRQDLTWAEVMVLGVGGVGDGGDDGAEDGPREGWYIVLVIYWKLLFVMPPNRGGTFRKSGLLFRPGQLIPCRSFADGQLKMEVKPVFALSLRTLDQIVAVKARQDDSEFLKYSLSRCYKMVMNMNRECVVGFTGSNGPASGSATIDTASGSATIDTASGCASSDTNSIPSSTGRSSGGMSNPSVDSSDDRDDGSMHWCSVKSNCKRGRTSCSSVDSSDGSADDSMHSSSGESDDDNASPALVLSVDPSSRLDVAAIDASTAIWSDIQELVDSHGIVKVCNLIPDELQADLSRHMDEEKEWIMKNGIGIRSGPSTSDKTRIQVPEDRFRVRIEKKLWARIQKVSGGVCGSDGDALLLFLPIMLYCLVRF